MPGESHTNGSRLKASRQTNREEARKTNRDERPTHNDTSTASEREGLWNGPSRLGPPCVSDPARVAVRTGAQQQQQAHGFIQQSKHEKPEQLRMVGERTDERTAERERKLAPHARSVSQIRTRRMYSNQRWDKANEETRPSLRHCCEREKLFRHLGPRRRFQSLFKSRAVHTQTHQRHRA